MDILCSFLNIDKEKISLLNPWQYQGKRFDQELNLIYFGKRYYDPIIAKWISTDPIGFKDSLNLYQYVKNNPFKFIDPYGENLLGWCLGVGEMFLGGTLMVTGAFIEIGSFGTLTFAVGIQEAVGLSLIGHGFSQAMIHSRDISFTSSKTIEAPIVMWKNSTETSEKNNPFAGPVDEDIFAGDAEGNIIPVPEGHQISGSKDGKWIQVKESSDNGRGKPTGVRKDGGLPKSPKTS